MYFGTILHLSESETLWTTVQVFGGGVISAWEGKAILLFEGDSQFTVNSATLGGAIALKLAREL